MNFNTEKLYELLPAFYRLRDIALADTAGEDAGPLKALLSIIAEQMAVLEDNLDQLYADQFIETCAEWVVPYIGDLVGTRGLNATSNTKISQRAEVANTISYRRRKGTASVLQQLAQDATQWNANVVEYFELLATTQYMKHTRLTNLSMSPIRDVTGLFWSAAPFDPLAHTADVRSIVLNRGKYNIPNIGIYLWRIQSFSSTQAPAFAVDNVAACYRYKFNPLGKDLPLYQKPKPEENVTHLAGPLDVPQPIRRRVMRDDPSDFYGMNTSLQIFAGGAPIPGAQICVCDLSDLVDSTGHVTGWNHLPVGMISMDPALGRLAFPTGQAAPTNVLVSYYYGFCAAIGGGEYDRSESFTDDLPQMLRVPDDRPTIQQALDDIYAGGGVVEIQNNAYYNEALTIRVNAGTTIEMRAADNMRPILVSGGGIVITGGQDAELSINGLFLSGGWLNVPATDGTGNPNLLGTLQLMHCTLAPGDSPAIGNIVAAPAATRILFDCPNATLSIDSSIIGGLRAVETSTVIISDSILDGGGETQTAFAAMDDQGPGAVLTVKNTTVIGKVYTRIIEASNTIFYGRLGIGDLWLSALMAERLQEGCVRFCYLPPGARVPSPYRCQPGNAADPAAIQPVFNSLAYGDADYCQLNEVTDSGITQGADDGSEMGVYHLLYQPQRLSNLRTRLDEYLRFGLDAGIFLAS
jgi:hypothetical protein